MIFGLASAVVAAYALWNRLQTTNPVGAGIIAERIHTQTNVLVRLAALVHSVISLFAGLRPAALPKTPTGSRMLQGRRTFGKPAWEAREDEDDDDDD